MSRILITGAPGAGKTTLLLALQARGYTIVSDTPAPSFKIAAGTD
jgi:predicted ATPase